jgi:phosphatidylserine/phosphatidylglycerophosphate/cardiolipin synthase-like enzyme
MLTLADLDQYRWNKSTPVDPSYPSIMRTFYAPEDDVHGALKAVIGSCTQSLVIAMYGYDDEELAALVDEYLKNAAIFCQITLDSSQAGGVHERELLAKYAHEMTGNSVAIGRSEHGAIMHRKMAIVDGLWFVGGSTNWSVSGESKQDNQLTVVQNGALCTDARRVLDIEHDSALQQMAAKAATADGSKAAQS